jgi:hypothetical protein
MCIFAENRQHKDFNVVRNGNGIVQLVGEIDQQFVMISRLLKFGYEFLEK